MNTSKYLLLFFLSLAVPAHSQEVDLVKYLCSSASGAAEVVHMRADLLHGLSRLPSGCSWISPPAMGEIGATQFHVDASENQVARIAKTTVDGVSGYSSGIVELLY